MLVLGVINMEPPGCSCVFLTKFVLFLMAASISSCGGLQNIVQQHCSICYQLHCSSFFIASFLSPFVLISFWLVDYYVTCVSFLC